MIGARRDRGCSTAAAAAAHADRAARRRRRVAEIDGPRPAPVVRPAGGPHRRQITRRVADARSCATLATFNQKPRIPRGLLTLAILAGIIALWASCSCSASTCCRQGRPGQGRRRPTSTSGGVQDVPLEAVAGAALGKVTAESTGEGLARITVEAYRVDVRSGESEMTASAGTAEDGTYTLAGLLPGHATSCASPPRASTSCGTRRRRPRPTPRRSSWTRREEVDGPRRDDGRPAGARRRHDRAARERRARRSRSRSRSAGRRAGRRRAAGEPSPAAAGAGRQETTGGQIAFDGPASRRRPTASASRPEGFAPQEFDADPRRRRDSVLNTVRLGAADGSIAGTVAVERRRSRSATSRSTVTSGEIEKRGHDADGRQRRHVPRRRAGDAAHVRPHVHPRGLQQPDDRPRPRRRGGPDRRRRRR